jgi:hypothetical protein
MRCKQVKVVASDTRSVFEQGVNDALEELGAKFIAIQYVGGDYGYTALILYEEDWEDLNEVKQ